MSVSPASPLPLRAPSPSVRTAFQLLAQARQDLAAANSVGSPDHADERFATAHLAALRCAAAVVALTGEPTGRAHRPRSAWLLLAMARPELAEWAQYFAAGASRRAAIDAGAVRVVTAREADDLVRAVREFSLLAEARVVNAAREHSVPSAIGVG